MITEVSLILGKFFQWPVPITRNARLFKRPTSPVITEEKDLERKSIERQERRLLFSLKCHNIPIYFSFHSLAKEKLT